MSISDYIINDISIQSIHQNIKNLAGMFDKMTYNHIPIEKDGVYVGCISENDVRCFEKEKSIEDYLYSLEPFFVRKEDSWLEALEAFAKNNTNILPVLQGETQEYLGYLELNDIMSLFNETPFLHEAGGIIVVEKGFKDFSFSEISQIIESNDGKIFGAFISDSKQDVAQITIKTSLSGINEIIQSFRRYGYNIISSHQEDSFYKNLKERSDYLNKYLNI